MSSLQGTNGLYADARSETELTNNFPHVSVIDLSFLEKPDFDFVLRPVGFDLSIIPGLSGFIHSQVHANLGPMMCVVRVSHAPQPGR